jgi:glutathione S-transferase
MSTETTTSLRVSRVINSNREAVWAAWTEEAQMKKWMAPEGVKLEICTADVSVGGSYHLRMHTPDDQIFNAKGVYKRIERPDKLVYTWRWEEPEHDCGETLVTVELTEVGEATEVVITHDGFPNAEAKDGHVTGWTSCLDGLESQLS